MSLRKRRTDDNREGVNVAGRRHLVALDGLPPRACRQAQLAVNAGKLLAEELREHNILEKSQGISRMMTSGSHLLQFCMGNSHSRRLVLRSGTGIQLPSISSRRSSVYWRLIGSTG